MSRAAEYRERRWCVEGLSGEQTVEIIDPSDWLFAKRHDDVTFANVCAPGWTLRVDGHHQHAAPRREGVKPDETAMERDVLAADPQVASFHPTVLQQVWHDGFGRVDRDSEAEPCPLMMIAVLMPITLPVVSTSGPPEFPGFNAARA